MPRAKAKLPVFTKAERDLLASQRMAEAAVQYIEDHRPAWNVSPHDRGQVQALGSDKTYRILIPGNGWGKTTCMALDLDLLMQGDDPFKRHVMPPHCATAIWYCQKYQQFEVMRPDLESRFSAGWRWDGSKHYYRWPNGARCFVLSSDSDWTAIQGVEIDAVYYDEHPDRKFWVEMQYRRRGRKKTRYMVAATMTQGMTWFVEDMIKPVEQLAVDQGMTHDEALRIQPHPTTFLWDEGGIQDNPAMTEEDAAHYDSITAASEKEKEVRRRGGYADFTGEAVFVRESLDEMEKIARTMAPGVSGSLVYLPDTDPDMAERIQFEQMVREGHRFHEASRELFEWRPGIDVEAGRITIFDLPDAEMAPHYVIGADFAAGLVGKDYDTAFVLGKTRHGQAIQVAEARGHWGDVFFAEVLYALAVFYYDALIVGERQFGLPCLRRLYDEMGYTRMYYYRRLEQRARRISDLLGHHRGPGDTVIADHRKAVRDLDVLIRSHDAIREHQRYQFQPRNKSDVIDDVHRSADLITSAPSGENDDLVMAACYGTMGLRELDRYPPPRRGFRPGTFGAEMDLENTLVERPKKRDPFGPIGG